MRTKLLFFFFLLMLLQVNMSTSAMVLKDAHRIMLKDIKASGSHRSMPVLPTAFIDGSLLSVDFLSAVTSAAVTVRNSATGEIVYSSVEMNVTTLRIDLTGKSAGEYSLEIGIGDTILSGDFLLENDLVNRGVFATPTIIVNDRLVYMTNSYEELSRLLEYELR